MSYLISMLLLRARSPASQNKNLNVVFSDQEGANSRIRLEFGEVQGGAEDLKDTNGCIKLRGLIL